MAYSAFQFDRFDGGLNLRDKADVVGEAQAIDLLNVEFTDVGAVRQRDGFVVHTTAPLTNRVDSLSEYYESDGTRQLLAGAGTRLEAINTSGGVIDSETGLAGGPWSFVRFAAPGSEFAYAGNGTDTLRKWDGATWTAPTATVDGIAAQAMPEAGLLAVMPNSHRLVATGFGTNTTGGPDAVASNPSRVYFSEASNPEAWITTNWVDLSPGDGEKITGAVTWRDQMIIFKETKYFVFGPESIDDQGDPDFNFYDVSTGIGLATPHAITSAREGVYFMSRYGVYATQGGEPQLLSELIEPIWRGGASVYFQSNTLNHSQIALSRMAWHDERLYLAIPTGTASANDRVLVHDLKQRWWSIYDLPASALVSWRQTDQTELHFGVSVGDNDVDRVSALVNDDDGTVITSRWRSGWGDYKSDRVKRVRETKVWGSGAVDARFSKNFEQNHSTSQDIVFGSAVDLWADGTDLGDLWGDGTDLDDTWGGGGQINPVLARRAIRGTLFSTEFTNLAGSPTWSIHRVSRHLAGQVKPSTINVG